MSKSHVRFDGGPVEIRIGGHLVLRGIARECVCYDPARWRPWQYVAPLALAIVLQPALAAGAVAGYCDACEAIVIREVPGEHLPRMRDAGCFHAETCASATGGVRHGLSYRVRR